MLSERLKSIVKFVSSNDIILDVGCDHGLVPIELVKQNIVLKCYASDNKQSALNNAIKNVKEEKLELKIKTILMDGISNIPDDVNTLIIAGMGTHNILNILKDKQKLKKINKLILQSNNNHYYLRKKIAKLGFYIKGERVVLENNKYYITIMLKKGYKRYSYSDLMFGPILKTRNININYYIYLKEDYERLLKLLPKKRLFVIIKTKYLIFLLKNIISKLEK